MKGPRKRKDWAIPYYMTYYVLPKASYAGDLRVNRRREKIIKDNDRILIMAHNHVYLMLDFEHYKGTNKSTSASFTSASYRHFAANLVNENVFYSALRRPKGLHLSAKFRPSVK